jgi:PAS domain S-box-containing protein
MDGLVERLIASFISESRDHAIVCIDAQGRIAGWLGAAERIFGFTADEMQGRPAGAFFTPEDRERGFDEYELELARRDSRAENERWHVRKDGARIWATGTVQALRAGDGTLMGYVKIMRDGTDTRTQLEHLENETRDLREAQQRTHDFLSTLGHEIRNPLAPVRNAGHILRRLSADPRLASTVDVIDRQVGVISKLAEDLMDVARAGAGKVKLHTRVMDLRELLQEAAYAMRASAEQKGLQLHCLLPEAPLKVDIDADRFERVVLNLLGNAIKYTPKGGNVWLKATQEGDTIVLGVEDTGIGIAPDVLPRIFDLFTQEQHAADLVPGGLGIGLTIVKQLVALHGGSVQALSSGSGKGAEFTVRLPAAR